MNTLKWARRQRRAVAAALLAMTGAAGTASAQNAVSSTNAKIDLRGGWQKSVESGLDGGAILGTGSLTMPLGQSFGMQLDAGLGAVDRNFYGSAAGHLFWRDPTLAMLGGFAQISTLDKAMLGRFGGRGEFFASSFTFGGYAGWQVGDRGKSVRVKDGFIAGLDLAGYITDNFVIRGGVGSDASKWYGRAGLEFQPNFPSLPGLAFFADGGGGESGQRFALGGVRFYFGADKSLKRRHREDDPVALPTTEIPQFRKYRRGGDVGGGGGNDVILE